MSLTFGQSPDCNKYPFQVLLLDGWLMEEKSKSKIQIGDFIGLEDILSLKSGYLVLIDCEGSYLEFKEKCRIGIKAISKKNKVKSKNRINFNLLQSQKPIHLKKGIIEYDAPIYIYSPNPFIDKVLLNNTSDLCIQWFDVLSKTKNNYYITLKDIYGEAFYNMQIDTSWHIISKEIFTKRKEFILEVGLLGSKFTPSNKLFILRNDIGRMYDCNNRSALENLLIGFYLELNGFDDSASKFFSMCANEKNHAFYQELHRLFLIRNKH